MRTPYSTPITAVERAAARAFRRAWNPQAAAHSLAADLDAGFDAGEWSGPAHADAEQAAFTVMIGHVADRYSMDPARLDRVVTDLAYIEQGQFFDAAMKRVVA